MLALRTRRGGGGTHALFHAPPAAGRAHRRAARPRQPLTAPAAALAGRLREIVGADGVLTDPADCAPFLVDHLGRCRGRAVAVVQPRSLAHVSQLLGLCDSERVGVVPHGGNTSYCGGAIPADSGRQLVLSLKHLNRIRSVDVTNYSLTAEAGCILSQVQQAADAAGGFFPLSLGSQGSCQIGGHPPSKSRR